MVYIAGLYYCIMMAVVSCIMGFQGVMKILLGHLCYIPRAKRLNAFYSCPNIWTGAEFKTNELRLFGGQNSQRRQHSGCCMIIVHLFTEVYDEDSKYNY